jgi:peptidyl-prolyl cis-trans isomerase C
LALKSTFRLVGLISAVTCALLLAACGQNKVAERPPEPGDTAVARVNGQVIWASDVKREAVAQGLISEGEPLDVSSEVFRQRLDEVIDQKLLASEASKRKIDKEPVAQRRLAAARERILGDMLVEGVVEKAVTEDAIRKLYAEQQKLSKRSEEIRARQIIVGSQAEAESVKKLLASGASFDALAMERSTDQATRFNGGDLGYFTLDVMPEPYGVALKDAQKGALVGPFAAEGGWVLVKVEDKRTEEPITLEAARPQIVRFLTYDQVRDILEKLRGSAKVEMLIGKPQDAPATAAQEPASAPADLPGGAPASAPPPPAAQPAKK